MKIALLIKTDWITKEKSEKMTEKLLKKLSTNLSNISGSIQAYWFNDTEEFHRPSGEFDLIFEMRIELMSINIRIRPAIRKTKLDGIGMTIQLGEKNNDLILDTIFSFVMPKVIFTYYNEQLKSK